MTISVRDYPDEPESFAARIDEQVKVLVTWLTDSSLGEQAFEHSGVTPKTRDDIEDFVRINRLRELDPADVVVIYVTGHGVESGGGRHFLLLGDSDEERLAPTAYRTSDLLAAVLGTDADHVLVLVDSCHAGAVNEEWASLRKDLPRSRRKLSTLGVLASGDFDEKSRIGEFASLLALVYERLRGPAQIVHQFLSFYDLVTEIGAVLKEDCNRNLQAPLSVWLPNPFHEQSLCLPNPGYRPRVELVEPARQQVAVDSSDLDDYWVSRASGRVGADDDTWYFSGRKKLNEDVVSFLQSGSGVLVITGVAGSGKSAVLARAVTLSDPGFVEKHVDIIGGVDQGTRPPVRSIDAAVLARGKRSGQIIVDLIMALGGEVGADVDPVIDDLRGLLTSSGVPRTLVIDGLDEALHPNQLVTDVLVPLINLRHPHTATRMVRLLLGLRSAKPEQDIEVDDVGRALVDQLHCAAAELTPVRLERTDEAPAVTRDIAAYVAAVLRRSGPYEDASTEVVGAAAGAVAERVSPSFLDARLAAQQLRDADMPQDLNDEAWLATLTQGTVALFRDDVVDVAAAVDCRAVEIVAVLRATAFALGRGLPWSQVWPAVAAAVIGREIPDADRVIEVVIASRLSGYLSRDVEGERVVYRPNHERLTETLRDDAASLVADATDYELFDIARLDDDAADVHQRITVEIISSAEYLASIPPNPYLRRYLVEHAYRGGVLDDGHIPSAFIPWEQGSRIRGRLGLPPPLDAASSRLAAWARIEPYLHDADDMSRHSSYAFVCAAAGLDAHIDSSNLALKPVWSKWQPPGIVLAAATNPVLSAVPLRSGRFLLAIGDQDGLRLWDPESATPVGNHFRTDGAIRKLAAISLPTGQVWLATSGNLGQDAVRLWDPETGQQLKELDTNGGAVEALTGFSLSGGQVMVAASINQRGVRLWDPETGDHLRDLDAGGGVVRALATVTLPCGQVLLAGGGSMGSNGVRLWDPGTGEQLRDLDASGLMVGSLAAISTLEGRVLLAGGLVGHVVRLWDPGTGRRVHDFGGDGAGLVAFSLPSGRLLLAGGQGGHGVRLWDPETRQHLRDLDAGGGVVWALTTVTLASGRVMLVGGGGLERYGVQLWDPEKALVEGRSAAVAGNGAVGAIAATSTRRGRALLAGTLEDVVRIWDPESGQQVRDLASSGGVRTLTPIILQSGRALLAGTLEDVVRIWDPESGEQVRDLASSGGVRTLTPIILEGGRALLAGSSLQYYRRPQSGSLIWDPESGQPVEDLGLSGDGAAWSELLTATTLPTGRVLLAGVSTWTLRSWDLGTGQGARDFDTGGSAIKALTVAKLANGQFLLVGGCTGGLVRLWDLETGQRVRDLKLGGGAVRALAAVNMPTGRVLLAASGTDGVRLVDPETGGEVLRLVTGRAATTIIPVTAATGIGLAISGPGGVAYFSLDSGL
ncbi:hypothetical protein OG921_16100 [Aldersonia sp. NBC_00410]|uniref:hypothetical protein n=1 Tax=Aldersonia sp. NBC_00410 TaxID=2975954 RepID=UPI0022547A2C|nr:hypothetical protein [Aldersonia sp. NBC_00410]MCX5044689.1 hypothetical protein [Aldersonia sp. NBC_00410]